MAQAMITDLFGGGGEGVHYIFRAWFRHPKTGEKIWAKHYGYKAWRIPVRKPKP